MSSESDLDSDASTPPKPKTPPCMFTVEQFQQASPSQETDSEPSNVYIVRPTAIWDSLQRFKEVAIEDEDEHYRIHDTVTVTRYDLPGSPLWTALVLEIRGHKPSASVFIRVFWFYQPSQLPPALRHSYHGRRELLASNFMSVIDATAVAGRVHVSHWHEEHESVPATGLFWRQTYNVQTQMLSGLHAPCPPPCILHQNPDEALISCPSPGCNARMHKSCVLDATLSRVKAALTKAEAVSSKQRKKKARKLPSLGAEWMDGRCEGYGALVTEGPVGQDGHFWAEDVCCLGCGRVMR